MELVETRLSALQRRAGAAWVPRQDLAAQQVLRGEPVRLLVPGDDVLLQAEDGSVHRGYVLRNVGSGADGGYVITFGAAVSRHVPVGEHRPVVRDVEAGLVPAQREPWPNERRRANPYR